jgi:hypothetical protein
MIVTVERRSLLESVMFARFKCWLSPANWIKVIWDASHQSIKLGPRCLA